MPDRPRLPQAHLASRLKWVIDPPPSRSPLTAPAAAGAGAWSALRKDRQRHAGRHRWDSLFFWSGGPAGSSRRPRGPPMSGWWRSIPGHEPWGRRSETLVGLAAPGPFTTHDEHRSARIAVFGAAGVDLEVLIDLFASPPRPWIGLSGGSRIGAPRPIRTGDLQIR